MKGEDNHKINREDGQKNCNFLKLCQINTVVQSVQNLDSRYHTIRVDLLFVTLDICEGGDKMFIKSHKQAEKIETLGSFKFDEHDNALALSRIKSLFSKTSKFF